MRNKNIICPYSKVSYEDKCKIMMQQGMVVWFTGLSGSGKSTIAIEVEHLLTTRNYKVVLLDGDIIRKGLNSDLGFHDEDRNENIRRIIEVAKLLCNNALIVLVSAITPFEILRKKAREKIGQEQFLEIYIKADLRTCQKRDPKGFYKKNIDLFTGVSSSYEIPNNPDIIVDTETRTINECSDFVLSRILQKIDKQKR